MRFIGIDSLRDLSIPNRDPYGRIFSEDEVILIRNNFRNTWNAFVKYELLHSDLILELTK